MELRGGKAPGKHKTQSLPLSSDNGDTLPQAELDRYAESSGDEDVDSEDDGSQHRSAKTKSLASFQDVGSDVGSEDTRSQISMGSSRIQDNKSAVSFGFTEHRQMSS